MTRSELVAALAQRFPGLMLKDAHESVKEILEAIADTLAKGDRKSVV